MSDLLSGRSFQQIVESNKPGYYAAKNAAQQAELRRQAQAKQDELDRIAEAEQKELDRIAAATLKGETDAIIQQIQSFIDIDSLNSYFNTLDNKYYTSAVRKAYQVKYDTLKQNIINQQDSDQRAFDSAVAQIISDINNYTSISELDKYYKNIDGKYYTTEVRKAYNARWDTLNTQVINLQNETDQSQISIINSFTNIDDLSAYYDGIINPSSIVYNAYKSKFNSLNKLIQDAAKAEETQYVKNVNDALNAIPGPDSTSEISLNNWIDAIQSVWDQYGVRSSTQSLYGRMQTQIRTITGQYNDFLKSKEDAAIAVLDERHRVFGSDLKSIGYAPEGKSSAEYDQYIKDLDTYVAKYDLDTSTPEVNLYSYETDEFDEYKKMNKNAIDLYNAAAKKEKDIYDAANKYNFPAGGPTVPGSATGIGSLFVVDSPSKSGGNLNVTPQLNLNPTPTILGPITPTFKPYQLDPAMDENGFYKLNSNTKDPWTDVINKINANYDASIKAQPTKIETFINDIDTTMTKINADFFKTPLGSAIENIPIIGPIYKDVIVPVGQAPVTSIVKAGPRLVSGDIGQTITGGSDLVAAFVGGPAVYSGLKTIETGANKGIWNPLIQFDQSGKQTGLIADITNLGKTTPGIGEYVGYGGELIGGLTYAGLHSPTEFYTFGKVAGSIENVVPYGKYALGGAFGVQTAASSVMGDEPNWGKAITQGALVTAAPYLIKNIPKVPVVKYYEGLRGKAEWLADIPKAQQREALDIQKMISDLKGQTKISNPLNLDRVASIKTPQMKTDVISFAEKNPEIIYGGSTQLERGMTGTIKRAPQDLEAYFKTTNIKPNKETSWADLGKPVIPKSLAEDVLDVHPQQARNIQQSAYFKAQKTPVPELFPTLKKTLGPFDRLSGAIEETTIMGTNIKIKAVNPFNIAVRKGTAAYDIGNPDKITGIKTPIYRYSKDIPAFIQYAKDISAQRQISPTTNIPVVKQYYEWKAGRLSARLESYGDLFNVEKAPATANRQLKKVPLIKMEWFGKKIEPILGEKGSLGGSAGGKVILPSFDKGYYFEPKTPLKVNLTIPGYVPIKTNYNPTVDLFKGYNIPSYPTGDLFKGYGSPTYNLDNGYTPKDYTPKGYTPLDYTPKDYTPKDYTPRDYIPKDYTPRDYIPKDYTPRDYIPKDYTPRDYVPRDFVPRDYTPKDYTPRDYTPKDYTPRDYTPRDYTPRDYTPKDYTPRDYIPRESVPRERKFPTNIPFESQKEIKKANEYAKSYDVYIRKGTQKRKVKEQLVQRGLPYGAAANLGLGIAAEYSQRTAILKPSKKPAISPDQLVNKSLLSQFRPLALRSKIPQSKQSRTFVEKSRYAINTIQEKKGIPYKAAAMAKARKNNFGAFGGMRI